MSKYIIFLAFISCVFGDQFVGQRIIGGNTALIGEFPYHAAIAIEENNTLKYFCGGAVISNRFVLTAAQCVYRIDANNIFVAVGTISLNQGGTIYSVKYAIPHKDYNGDQFMNDIALIKVNYNIEFNRYVQPIPLQTYEVGVNQVVTVSGWGLTSYPGTISNSLQHAQLTTISTADCRNLTANMILDTEICTLTKKGQGICFGDGGSPLVYRGKLSGVVSWIYPCAQGKPDVYVKVSAFYRWIQTGVDWL